MSDPTPLADVAFLSALLDTLVPPRGVLPGAGGIGIELAVAEAVASDAQAGPAVAAGLGALRQQTPGFASLTLRERPSLVEAALDPATLRAMLRHVYLVYYQHPMVLAAVGEPPRPPFPEGFELEPTDPELLAALLARKKQVG